MKYRVRSKDGELEYESFKQLEEAAQVGFLDPEDELLREGETEWKKVSTQPALMKGKRRTSWWTNPLLRWVVLPVLGGCFSLWALAKGEESPEFYAFGLLVAFLSVIVLFKVTADAQKRRK